MKQHNTAVTKSECLTEVKLHYVSKVKASDRPKITSSKDAYNVLRNIYDETTIELRETALMLILNRANKVIGWYKIGDGGTSSAVIDIRLIMQAAILGNASGIILSHNHPSGNTKPSNTDVILTKKVGEALKFFEINLLDHIIITSESYHSMCDEGEL